VDEAAHGSFFGVFFLFSAPVTRPTVFPPLLPVVFKQDGVFPSLPQKGLDFRSFSFPTCRRKRITPFLHLFLFQKNRAGGPSLPPSTERPRPLQALSASLTFSPTSPILHCLRQNTPPSQPKTVYQVPTPQKESPPFCSTFFFPLKTPPQGATGSDPHFLCGYRSVFPTPSPDKTLFPPLDLLPFLITVIRVPFVRAKKKIFSCSTFFLSLEKLIGFIGRFSSSSFFFPAY